MPPKLEQLTKPPDDDFPLIVRPRDFWGAKEPLYTEPLEIPIMYMCVSVRQPHRECEDELQILREMQQHDIEKRGMPDIESNFLIGNGGVVYEGRGWFTRPSLGEKYTPQMKQHLGKYLQITHIGDYETDPNNNPLLKANSLMFQKGLRENTISRKMQFLDFKIVKGDSVTFESLL